MQTDELIKTMQTTAAWKAVEDIGCNPESVLRGSTEEESAKLSQKWAKYSNKTAITFATSKLNSFIASKSGDTVQGMVIAGTDRYGSKAPITYMALLKDGTGAKLCAWDNMFTEPCVTTILGKYNSAYNNYLIKEVKSSETIPDIDAKLIRIAKSTDTSFKKVAKYDIAVIRGRLQYVNPNTKWTYSEAEGKNVVDQNDKYNPLLVDNEEDQPVRQPCINFTLDPENGNNNITLQFPRQRKGHPIIKINDLGEILVDAMEEWDTPESQARYARDGLQGREVVAVGEVVSMTTKDDRSGNETNYINLSCCYISEIPAGTPVLKEQETLIKEEPVKKSVAKKESDLEKMARLKKELKETQDSTPFAVNADKIVKMCNILGKAPGYLTIDEIRTAMEWTPEAMTDAMITSLKTRAGEIYTTAFREKMGVDPVRT